MRTRGRWLLIAVMVWSYALVAPARAHACSCGPDSGAQAELAQADAVFEGDVVAISPTLDSDYWPGWAVTFEVTRQWKGPATSHFTVETGLGGGDCGYSFVWGQRYLVYAWEYQGEFGTGICSCTAPIHQAHEDLQVLGEGQLPPAPAFASSSAPALPILILGALSGFSSVRQWGYVWARLGLSGEGPGAILGVFLLYCWWRWWRSWS